MGGLFGGGPKAPPPPPPPTPPVEAPSMDDARKGSREREDELRRRSGRAASVLSTDNALSTKSAPKTGTRKLLGE